MIKSFKIVVEKHSDGYVAYPIGLKGVVVGEGNTYEEALHNVKSAIAFHMETFGPEIFDEASSALEVFIARRPCRGRLKGFGESRVPSCAKWQACCSAARE
jgi:predicted RNase H-like HicB family nuclease